MMINDLQTGHTGWGIINAGLAFSDVFLVDDLAKAAGKVGWAGLVKTGGSHTWRNTKSWMVRRGWRDFTEQPFHHWLFPQNGWAKDVPEVVKNQPYNILRVSNQTFHNAIEGKGAMKFLLPGRLWYGSPTWAKLLLVEILGRSADFIGGPDF